MIFLDIRRTYPENVSFTEDGYLNPLSNVLTAFASYNTKVGYCQVCWHITLLCTKECKGISNPNCAFHYILLQILAQNMVIQWFLLEIKKIKWLQARFYLLTKYGDSISRNKRKKIKNRSTYVWNFIDCPCHLWICENVCKCITQNIEWSILIAALKWMVWDVFGMRFLFNLTIYLLIYLFSGFELYRWYATLDHKKWRKLFLAFSWTRRKPRSRY